MKTLLRATAVGLALGAAATDAFAEGRLSWVCRDGRGSDLRMSLSSDRVVYLDRERYAPYATGLPPMSLGGVLLYSGTRQIVDVSASSMRFEEYLENRFTSEREPVRLHRFDFRDGILTREVWTDGRAVTATYRCTVSRSIFG